VTGAGWSLKVKMSQTGKLLEIVIVGFIYTVEVQYWDSVDNTVEKSSSVLVAISKGIPAVKLCTNKILQLLIGGAS